MTRAPIVAALALAVLALFAGTAAARIAPTVVIASAPDAVTADASPRFAFATLDATDDATFECRLDGAPVACAANGPAGSYSAMAPHTAVAPPLPPAVAQPTTATAPAPTRVPRLEIGEACMEVSAARANARVRVAGRTAIARFRAPAAARYAKVTLRRGGGRRRGAVIGTLADARVGRPGAMWTARIALTRGQRSLIRSGAARLAIAYGTCRSQVGAWDWVTPAGA